jgi:F-type H+-transporting ATPase subunit b
MDIDWTTFLLELINFAILVWILKRFLYAPVRRALEARRERAEAALREAEARGREVEEMARAQTERQAEWEREREEARAALGQEIAQERARRLDEVDQEARQRADRAAARAGHEREEQRRRDQEAALDLAGRFASRLLARLDGPELEAALVRMLQEDLQRLDTTRRHTLEETMAADPGCRILSAFPLDGGQREALGRALGQAAGCEVQCSFAEEPALMAGVEIEAGDLALQANLRDELRFFSEAR